MDKIVYLYSRDLEANGIMVILKTLGNMLSLKGFEVCFINSLNNVDKKSVIIPYGLLSSNDLINQDYNCSLSLMVDALSLGVKSELRKYLFSKEMSLKLKIIQFSRIVKYCFLEFKVFKKFDSVMLVSEFDIQYFKNNILTSKNAYKSLLAKNGVCVPVGEIIYEVIDYEERGVRFGVLAYWHDEVFLNMRYFIDKYWTDILMKYPKATLHIAGRGDSSYIKRYLEGKKNIVFVGEVENVADFYSSIDIALITLQKKCGILNKVLEAFAFKKIVLGLPQNFYALENVDNTHFEYIDKQTLFKSLDIILNDQEEVKKRVDNAFKNILKFHSWDNNYRSLVNKILQFHGDNQFN